MLARILTNFQTVQWVHYIMSEKGYFDDEGFALAMKYVVLQLPSVELDPRWKLLCFDGYGPHTMVQSTVEFLFQHRIHAVCMPSHTSQVLQPLDVTCFAPVKHCFRTDLREIQFSIALDGVTRWGLPALFEMALGGGCSEKNIISGFRACGLIGEDQFTTSWVERNKQKIKISDTLKAERAAKRMAIISQCSHSSAAALGHQAKAAVSEYLQNVVLPTEVVDKLKAVVHEIDTKKIPLADRYAPLFGTPPKLKKRKSDDGEDMLRGTALENHMLLPSG